MVPTSSLLSPTAHGTERGLLVEDGENERTLARLVLENHSCAVLEARHGSEALALCLSRRSMKGARHKRSKPMQSWFTPKSAGFGLGGRRGN
jgi:hypothetical protein